MFCIKTNKLTEKQDSLQMMTGNFKVKNCQFTICWYIVNTYTAVLMKKLRYFLQKLTEYPIFNGTSNLDLVYT